ncbi:MAG: ATP-binding protein [Prolixibacteraceae bacterium]|jgi:signal transduction histidine kinase/ligand-binding sensor domain-containing protein|nr:ATP-binding protein [Prolixibacteraceae bacterium]
MRTGALFLYFFIIINCFQSFGQNYSFKRITTTEGLSNSWVRCIMQDKTGFIWVGTSDGLNRYDGSNFKTYRPLTDRKSSLGNITINYIIQRNENSMWIATDIGLYTFDIHTEEMYMDTILSPHPVLCITQDKDSIFWFGTNHGLIEYNLATNAIQAYSANKEWENSLSNDYVNTITVDSDNKLWIGTKKGLNLFNKTNHTFTIFQSSKNEGAISGNDITCIFEDYKKRIWVGTSMNGLNSTNLKNNNYYFTKIIDGTIVDLIADQSNQLWIGQSSEEGIYILNLENFNKNKLDLKQIKNDPLIKNTLSDNSISCLFVDKLNDIWVGTQGNGLNYYSDRSKPFHNETERYLNESSINNSLVNTFYEEEEYLWIGTEGGLDRITKKTGTFNHYHYKSNDTTSIASNPILSINKDSRGNLWVGTWAGGLNKFNYKSNNFKRYTPSDKVGSIGSANVFSIVEDSKNNLWIGTVSGGLNLFNYETETFKVYKKNDDPNSLSGKSMNYILETKGGELYISLYNILDKYNYEKDNFDHITRRNTEEFHWGNITSLFEDSNNNLWLATNAGLELFDSAFNLLKIYTTEDGLPDNTIQAILEDEHGNLWISTNKGISKFNNGINHPSNPIFQNFSMADGLPANDFKNRSAYKNAEGYLYFGSSNGYTKFHPDSVKINTIKPDVVLTNLLIQQSIPNKYSTYRSFNGNLNLTKRIDLNFPNTDFTISFSALNYLNSEKNTFKFKLDGYDTEWIAAGNATSATYTNLTEGNYTFMVMGSNNDGVWCKEAKKLTIVIHPPWWNTFAFKLFIFIFIFILSATILTIRFISLSKENKALEAKVDKRTSELTKLNILLEEKQVEITVQNNELEIHRNQLEELVSDRTKQLEEAREKAEESDKLKSAFLANMSHEIRTPMNAIIGFSAMLANKDLLEEKKHKYIQQIKTNGKNLNFLINDIIDISIIEAKQLVLSKSDFSVNKVLAELFHLFEIENNNRLGFNYKNHNETQEAFINNDAARFRQIMVNLLSNAFKYSDKGMVTYGFDSFQTEVQFFVTDNGIGISEKEKEKIFGHFYKSEKDNSKLYRGTGIGLAICKSLINQMGGKIWVESELRNGSTFYFTLPIRS